MKPSLSYHLTLLVLKLKGLKKDFSQDPIDFKKIRKADVNQAHSSFFKKCTTERFTVSKTTVTSIKRKKNSNQLILFIHGGAFISGPAKHHWDTIRYIVTQTEHTLWMCDYPKAPEHTIQTISENIDSVYARALDLYPADRITLIGDSVGGTLITALVKRLIQNKIDTPGKIILVSPVMDASLSNPEIERIDTVDPMLSKAGVLSAKKMCAGSTPLSDPLISPLNGSFEGFPKTILFLATHDITYPDQELAVKKLADAKVNLEIIKGERMPHIWPFLPVMKEAKLALQEIINRLH